MPTFTGTSGNDSLVGGSSADSISGLAGDDTLIGAGGWDTLDGGTGADSMVGGAGDDLYYVDDAGDVLVEDAGAGSETVYTTVNFTLGANLETLIFNGSGNFVGTGNDLDNYIWTNSQLTSSVTLEGSGGRDYLISGAGNDVLDGGDGGDAMYGGAGDDSYFVDNVGDVITEDLYEGVDTVYVSLNSYDTSGFTNTENIYFTGAGDFVGIGNWYSNRITGGAGNDTLNGGSSGYNLDTLIGGAGDDTFIVWNTGDTVTELSSEGTDTIIAYDNEYSLATAPNVENLRAGDTSPYFFGTGNDLDNHITGSDGSDYLDGGAGADTMVGGADGDQYYVDSVDDVVIEGPDLGSDTINTTLLAYDLTSVVNVEGLAFHGVGDFHGVGNADGNYMNGGAGNDTLDGGAGADVMYGGDGNDLYIVDNRYDDIWDTSGIDTVQTNLNTYGTFGSWIENLEFTGTGSFIGTGNSSANTITGGTDDDFLSGGQGVDTLIGGQGNDTLDGGHLFEPDSLIGGAGDDEYWTDPDTIVVELSDEGTDTVRTYYFYSLEDLPNVENLVILAAYDRAGTGNALNNVITSSIGADTLNGGLGADTLIGGAGNDVYVVDDAGDVVTEAANQGTDEVRIDLATYTLGANFENLTYTGAGSFTGFGNQFTNILTGGAGADTLDGGAGADSLIGCAGDDLYLVDASGDVVTETSSANGDDRVQSSVTYTLGAHLERLTLTGVANISGVGNNLANVIEGNAGANNLNGGAGADTLAGGLGNDIYFVENAGDVITEAANQGTDLVYSSVTWTLAANVENLILTGAAGVGVVGNALNNVITGNAAANSINGGLGADTLQGGLGDDVYSVDNTGDAIVEALNAGADSIYSSVTRTLDANVEYLYLSGNAVINGIGNALNNIIVGNANGNILRGMDGADRLNGGLGGDILYGGTGADGFVFNTALGGGNIDRIMDYSVADDTIWLENAILTQLTATGALNGAFFRVGAAAADANDYILYDSTSGGLFYDADGNGAGLKIQFATLSAGLALTNADFLVI